MSRNGQLLPIPARLERRCVLLVDRLPWVLARRLLRFVDFGDGTWAIGFRASKRAWLAVTDSQTTWDAL